MRTFYILLIFGCCLLNGCRQEKMEQPTFEVRTFASEHLDYPQDTGQITSLLQNEFVENFFKPWKLNPENLQFVLDSLPGKEMSYLEKYRDDNEWYGENKKPHAAWQREEIVANSDLENFPNFLKRGITIVHTDLRRVPTKRPGFDTYSKAGEGYPFDYFQETNLWANTPILIAHISNDRQWCYVISPYYKGWMSIHDVAMVDEEFVAKWSNENYCMPLSDVVNLTNDISHYAINAKMGMLLPYEDMAGKPNHVLVYYTNADENQNAKLLKAEVDKSAVTLGNIKFEESSLKSLVSNFLGRPYDWGGKLGNRDCSSLIRDLLGTYRIWLPRDSKDQMGVGHKYGLEGTADEKIKLIKDKGVPFLTILRKKGHNMLYVGNAPNGNPLILHAIWGLKTSYSNGQLAEFIKTYPLEGIHQDEDGALKGRFVIGEAVITSVRAGTDNENIPESIIDEIYAMTNILEQ